jgi:hypothetical protein
MWLRQVIVVLVLALLAACATRAPPPPPPAPPVAQAPPSCFAELDARGVGYERLPDFHTPEGCGIDQAIRVERSAIPWNRSSQVSCSFELTEWEFETKVVQPAAYAIFKRHVSQLIHAGTYDCRGERGGDSSRLSQHALGKAIDLLGFELDDGTKISVRRDWVGNGAKAAFLHQVAKGACAVFSMVLTPYSNAFHQDHIHLDTGPYKHCGM